MVKKRILTSLLSIGLMCATTFSYAVTYSPYYDVGLNPGWDGKSTMADISKIAGKAKIKAITLAFVQAPQTRLPDHQTPPVVGPGACWGGQPTYSVESGWGAKEVQAFQKNIGDVTISLGGQNAGAIENGYIAENYKTAAELAAVYQKLLDTYKGVKRLDWDIEGPRIEAKANDPEPNLFSKMAQAIATLQKNNPGLFVSLTLRVMPVEGLSPNVLKIIETMKKNNTRIDNINLMTMDYGKNEQNMGDSAIACANKVKDQLNLPLSKIGITSMIGINDTVYSTPPNTKEIFTLANAVQVYNFARKNTIHLGSWSLNRDHGGLPKTGATGVNNKNCGLWIADYAFASAFQTGKYSPAPPLPAPADVSVTLVNHIPGDKPGTYMWVDTKYRLDGKDVPDPMVNGKFKVPSGNHVIGLKVGGDLPDCPEYNFTKDASYTLLLKSYNWTSKKIDCTITPVSGDI